MADQLGLRRVIGNTFKTLWVVPHGADRAVLDAYFRVLQHADADLDQNPASCLPLWRYSIPDEFQDRQWDFARFDVGERFLYAPLEREEFDEFLQAAERWGLDDYMATRAFEELALAGTVFRRRLKLREGANPMAPGGHRCARKLPSSWASTTRSSWVVWAAVRRATPWSLRSPLLAAWERSAPASWTPRRSAPKSRQSARRQTVRSA